MTTQKWSTLMQLLKHLPVFAFPCESWASGDLGTGKVVVRNKYRIYGCYPFCLNPNEDTKHIMDYQHEETQGIWTQHLMKLVLTLHKAKFPHVFITAIKRELNTWRLRYTPHLLSDYPEPIRSMFQTQRQLGWNQFLLGFLPLAWKPHLLQFQKDKHLLQRYSTNLWTSKLIRAS